MLHGSAGELDRCFVLLCFFLFHTGLMCFGCCHVGDGRVVYGHAEGRGKSGGVQLNGLYMPL